MKSHSLRKRLSRRGFLGTATLAAGAAWCRADEGEPGFIDAHVHVWTPDTVAYPLAAGFEKSQMQPPSFTPDELLTQCRSAGVDRVVLIQMSFYQFDNRYLLAAIVKQPMVFRGVAIVDHQAPDVGKTMRQLHQQGVAGIRLYADAAAVGTWIDSGEIDTMWTAAADTGQAICLLANPDALPGIDRLCRRFPRTRVVIDHFARIGSDGTVRTSDVDNLCRLVEHKQVFVKTSAFYALGAKQAPYLDLAPMIRRLCDVFGGERLMWGSDCPYQVASGHTYAASVGLIRDRLDFLTADEKKWMLRKTAQTVFWN